MISMSSGKKGGMKIQYIFHSCFVVELEQHVLVFDYYKGRLPEFAPEKQVLFFASHAHHDHFNRKILKLRNCCPGLQFVLSGDIRSTQKEWREDVHFMEPGEELAVAGVEIRALRSTDEGVAFLAACEGRRLFHAGDLNWWHWEEEGSEWNGWVRMAFQKEISRLEGDELDAAVLVLDPRQEEAFSWGLDWFMRHTRTKLAFPMHMWGDYDTVNRFLALEKTAPYRDRVRRVERENQEFVTEGE